MYTPELEVAAIRMERDEVGTISVYIGNEIAIIATSEDQVEAFMSGLAMGYAKGMQAELVRWCFLVGKHVVSGTLDKLSATLEEVDSVPDE